MKTAHAIMLSAIMILTCYCEGRDLDASEDAGCTAEMSWAYCDAQRIELEADESGDYVAECGDDLDVVWIHGEDAVWARTCERVCLDACEEAANE